jgi:hypothetical protein
MWHKGRDECEDRRWYKKLTSFCEQDWNPWPCEPKSASVALFFDVVYLWKPSQGQLLACFYHVWLYLRGTPVTYRYPWRSNICRNHVENECAVLSSRHTWQHNDLENVVRGTWCAREQLLIPNCCDPRILIHNTQHCNKICIFVTCKSTKLFYYIVTCRVVRVTKWWVLVRMIGFISTLVTISHNHI